MEHTVYIGGANGNIVLPSIVGVALNHIGIAPVVHAGLQNVGTGIAVVMTGEDQVHTCLVQLGYQMAADSGVRVLLVSILILMVAGAVGRFVIQGDDPVKVLTGSFFVDNPVDEVQMLVGIGSVMVISVGVQHQEQNIVVGKVIVCACEVRATGIGSAVVGAVFLFQHIGHIDMICINGIGIVIMVARYRNNRQTL